MWPFTMKTTECFVWMLVCGIFMMLTGSLILGYKYSGVIPDMVTDICTETGVTSKPWHYFWLVYGYTLSILGLAIVVLALILKFKGSVRTQ